MKLIAKSRHAGLALVIALCCGCGGSGGGGSSGAAGVPDADGKVPFQILKAAIMAGNDGNYDESAKYLDPGTSMGKDHTGAFGYLDRVWDPLTRNGSVEKVEQGEERYQGQSVSVGYILHYGDGSTKEDKATLVKIDDRWKIQWLSSGF